MWQCVIVCLFNIFKPFCVKLFINLIFQMYIIDKIPKCPTVFRNQSTWKWKKCKMLLDQLNNLKFTYPSSFCVFLTFWKSNVDPLHPPPFRRPFKLIDQNHFNFVLGFTSFQQKDCAQKQHCFYLINKILIYLFFKF